MTWNTAEKQNRRCTAEEALERLLAVAAEAAAAENVSLYAAEGRTAAADLSARMNQPPFDRSPLDGYALHHEDTAGASKESPVPLPVTEKIFAGVVPGGPLRRGTAARIMTGAPLPEGADCVIRQEDTDQGETEVRLFVSAEENENRCFAGDDVKSGNLLVRKGTFLDYARLGVLASQGYGTVPVFRRPLVTILSCGNELTAPGEPLKPGKIYESSGIMLRLRAAALGAEIHEIQEKSPSGSQEKVLPDIPGTILPDDPGLLAAALEKAVGESDFVVTTGGVSVGQKDFLPSVCERLGAETLFRGVAMKPGSPTYAAVKDKTPILCLSGNPFAAFAAFELFGSPVIRKLAGRSGEAWEIRTGVTENGFSKASRGRRFLRAAYRDGRIRIPGAGHENGSLSMLPDCNCLLDIPAGSGPVEVGQEMRVIMFA